MITSVKSYTKINIRIRKKSASDSKPQVLQLLPKSTASIWDDSPLIQARVDSDIYPYTDAGYI